MQNCEYLLGVSIIMIIAFWGPYLGLRLFMETTIQGSKQSKAGELCRRGLASKRRGPGKGAQAFGEVVSHDVVLRLLLLVCQLASPKYPSAQVKRF